MKRFFLFLIAVALVPALAFGQQTKAQNPVKDQMTKKQFEQIKNTPLSPSSISFPTVQKKAMPEDKTNGITTEALVSPYFLQHYLSVHLMSGSCNTAYDPKSGILLFARQMYANTVIGDTTTPRVGQIWIHRSYDNGATWETNPIQIIPNDNKYYHAPSIVIANPYNTKNYDSLFIYVSTYARDFDTWAVTGMSAFRIFNGQTQKFESYETLIPDATWSFNKAMYGMKMNGGSPTLNFLSYGEPYNSSNDTRTDLYYAVMNKALNNGTLVTTEPEDLLVDQWATSNFYPAPSEVQAGYTVWSSPFGATGDDGTPYVMFYNFPNANSSRVPAVSKSNDAGSTWENIEWCPEESLLGGLKAINNEIFGAYDNFFWWNSEGDDLVAFDNDQLSYIRRFAIGYSFTNEENVLDTVYHYALVEITKNGNVWSAIPITTVNRTKIDDGTEKPFYGYDWWYVAPGAERVQGSQSYLFRFQDDEQNDKDTLITTQRCHEVQISKTPNGDLVAKWIDFTGQSDHDVYAFGTPTQLLNCDITLDTMAKTDVYMAYRKKGSSTWSTPLRVFGDNVMNFSKTSDFYPKKATFIPKIVPSINEIPLFDAVYDTTYDEIRATYPIAVRELTCDYVDRSFLVCHKVALDSTWNDTTSAEEPAVELKSTIGEIFPNPASDRIEFSFTLSRPAFVNVEIFNSVGEKVATVQNGTVNAIANAVSFNGVKDFPSGSYYCIVTIDGQKTTRKFTVAR